MGVKFLAALHYALVEGVRLLAVHFHNDGLSHLGRHHFAHQGLAGACLLFCVGRCLSHGLLLLRGSLLGHLLRRCGGLCRHGLHRSNAAIRPALLALDGLHARDVLLQVADLLQALGLPHLQLELQLEQLIGQVTLLVGQLDVGQIADLLCVHLTVPYCTPSRATNLVRSGSLCDARRMASAASACETPSISNRILPGRTTATQWSGAPLPLPIRVSAGFLVTGLSGNNRIQILPPRLIKRVMATRLASIWRSVIQPGSKTFKPKSPNDSVLPRQALPAMRPRCCLRYFTFFGINIGSSG